VEATTKKGAKVIVELEGRPDDIRLDVIDEGGGIALEIKDRLFQFGVTTKGDRGNGMGLWLVKQLVSRHGGTIDVDSTPRQGTRFTLVWPRRIPQNRPHEEPVSIKARR
jgi:two-component system sensor histidine kinase DctS